MSKEISVNTKKRKKKKGDFLPRLKKDFKLNKILYVMFLPVLAYFIIFHYIPMGGIVMAFQNFSIKKGILGSPFVGLEHFITFFNSNNFTRLIVNTLLLSFYGLLFSFPFPIIFALALNEVRNKNFKKVTQTISYLPYFISVVVVVGILNDFASANGILTNFAKYFGYSGGALMGDSAWFRPLYIGSNMWQHLGYNSIIFISALSAVDPELYEASRIDGAGRWKQTIYITLPSIASTIAVLLILRLGQIMNVGYEKIILMYSPATRRTADVISTYMYRVGMVDSNYSYSTAINLFNSLINFIVIFTANKISKKISETSLW